LGRFKRNHFPRLAKVSQGLAVSVEQPHVFVDHLKAVKKDMETRTKISLSLKHLDGWLNHLLLILVSVIPQFKNYSLMCKAMTWILPFPSNWVVQKTDYVIACVGVK